MAPTDADEEARRIRVAAPEARRLVHDVLRGHGVAAEHAALVARCLVAADLRGVDTHGINRLPSYCRRIRQGVLDAAAEPELTHATPVVAQVDARNGFGFVASRVYGIGLAVVKHSNHFGMSAWLVQQALDAGMMSLVFINSSPAMLPVGGPKGSALSIMMDVIAGVLSGSAFAGDVTSPYDASRAADVGHFLVAIKPDLFMSAADFRARMRTLYDRVVGCEPAAGVDRVYFPGELEHLAQREREASGIPLVRAEVDALNEEAARVSAEPLRTMG